jgi:hypothetical protein
VDTSNELVSVRVAGAKKRRRSVEERRKIVGATLQPEASVSRVARRHDVNANQEGGTSLRVGFAKVGLSYFVWTQNNNRDIHDYGVARGL